jgi:hypothetical protein
MKGGGGRGGGPGLGLGVGAVAVNQCPSTDQSIFCQWSRFFQVFMQVVTLIIVLWFIYTFAIPYIFKKGRSRS